MSFYTSDINTPKMYVYTNSAEWGEKPGKKCEDEKGLRGNNGDEK